MRNRACIVASLAILNPLHARATPPTATELLERIADAYTQLTDYSEATLVVINNADDESAGTLGMIGLTVAYDRTQPNLLIAGESILPPGLDWDGKRVAVWLRAQELVQVMTCETESLDYPTVQRLFEATQVGGLLFLPDLALLLDGSLDAITGQGTWSLIDPTDPVTERLHDVCVRVPFLDATPPAERAATLRDDFFYLRFDGADTLYIVIEPGSYRVLGGELLSDTLLGCPFHHRLSILFGTAPLPPDETPSPPQAARSEASPDLDALTAAIYSATALHYSDHLSSAIDEARARLEGPDLLDSDRTMVECMLEYLLRFR